MNRSSIELQRAAYRLDSPLRSAIGSWNERASLLVRLGSASGVEGVGEAAPLPGYSPETLEDCERALAALAAEPLLALADESVPERLGQAARALVPEHLPAARFALETALLDRAARGAGEPLWRLLAARTPEGPGPAAVRLCALLPSDDPAAALARARELVAREVGVFKLKIGPDRLGAAQAATLAALRGEHGRRIELRVDANRTLGDSWRDTARQLAAYEVELLEEPIAAPPEQLAGSPCPLALDESLQGLDPGGLERCLATSGARAVVLKPTTLGGLGACVQLAAAARARGCDVIVSHTLEGPIGWAACAHLALALVHPRAAGLAPLPHQRGAGPAIVGGRLLASAASGLGDGGA